MPETGRWRTHVFEVSSNVIRGFTGLTVKGSSETEEATADGQKYVKRKAGKPMESTVTVELSAYTGCNVRDEALAFVADATASKAGYFYVGSKKLVTAQLMLTEAEATEITIGPNGQWISCKVSLTMKQSSKDDNAVTKKTTNTDTGGDDDDDPDGGDDGGADGEDEGVDTTTTLADALTRIKDIIKAANAASKVSGTDAKSSTVLSRLMLVK